MKESIHYEPYLLKTNPAPKTNKIEEVTCGLCISKLLIDKHIDVEIRLVEKKKVEK